MAKVKSIKVEVNFTRNLGNYESLKLGAAAELEIEEGDNLNDIYSKAYDMCSNEISTQLKDFEDSRKKK
jgi:transcription elongation factor Elf1